MFQNVIIWKPTNELIILDRRSVRCTKGFRGMKKQYSMLLLIIVGNSDTTGQITPKE
jgi:hypothetical protein